MTISSVFIRRPRLAFVISTVITLAGVIALGALPVAQFPDIVPPQVKVTTFYPGASAQAVEESVAQVIEAQVNGVERMIYMKSTSGGDGSYSLTVSFEVGSDPDLNTVNVTNSVLDAVKRVPGVGDAALFGPLDYSMRVWLKLDRMSSLDITPNDVVRAVQAQNTQAAVGLVGAQPLMGPVDFQLN